MSFSVEFYARSRLHAKRQLEVHKSSLPAPVFAFLSSAIDNIQPAKDAQRAIFVKATGHLCEGGTWSPHSSATIEVKPIDIPD
ncbi:hypothetical protein JJC00_18715 [Bradyrhizobium diazoefficiens]|uniref:hypothetical protein n=1 Tax=Bradyrhizobium diazoefficiens TaxID=1355477 RepID=UPI00190ADC1E|nr:hypothetical protein [Bradyrhizobium diazoefficiens]QQO37462.1 hypothetical protein JJC00_18715 [Bradyrhizobium diazoefficiens]